ncbi:MAG: CBS domain-containing protein [Stellaceae bacterium]
MKTASTIMTTKVVTVTPETSVAEIASLLLEHKISAVPVIDDEQRVVGIVSEGDLLGRPPCGSPRGWWLRLFDESAACLEEIATARHLKARDVMTSPAVTVGEETPIDILATLMRRRRVKRVPILLDGRLVGIISRADVLDALARYGQEAASR